MVRQTRKQPHGRKASATKQKDAMLSTEQMAEKFQSEKARSTHLVEQWSRNKVGGKDLQKLYTENSRKARFVASSIENQNKSLKSLSEDVVSSTFQTRPENVLRLVYLGLAQSNRDRIFREWPIETDDAALYYIEKVVGNTLRDATSGDKITENFIANHPDERELQSIGTGNGATTAFTATLATTPVVPYSVHLIVGGELVGNDDGSGNITSSLLTGSNTVDYSSGAVSINFSTAPATGTSIEVEFNFDSEIDSLYPSEYAQVSLEVRRQRFNARPRPVGFNYTDMAMLRFNNSGLGDLDEELNNTAAAELAQARDYVAFRVAKRVAKKNPTVTFDANFASAGETSDHAHAQKLLQTIERAGGQVYNELKRGAFNKIIASTDVATYLSKHSRFQANPNPNKVAGSYFAGTIDGYEIFVTPSDDTTVADNEAILTFLNPDEMGEPGIAWGVLAELEAQLRYPNFRTEKNVARVEDYMVIQSKFNRLLKIENLDSSFAGTVS